jgi:phage portal protein BeeE
MGGPYLAALQSGPLLSVLGASYQEKAAAYLRAYKTSWFYKAESRISRDFANLTWTLSYEDSEGDNAEEIVAPANNIPFERLDPLEQFLRLSERPNPYQTGRQLKQQSQIRLDMTGRALIYLEGGDGGGLPTAMYGISPSRMWPSHNAKGELVGWVLDRNSPSGGTPFSADEIVAIEYAGIDDPVGVIEAIYAQVPLTDLIARHVGDVLTTGGRLAGMISPKNRSLDEDEYQDVLRAWRNVSSDPNAGRRLLVFPEPMDWTSGASTPTELGIPELSALTRDEILTAFPISPYMLGIPQPHGLASGEIRREERHDYWEATQHPRVEIWEDAIQQHSSRATRRPSGARSTWTSRSPTSTTPRPSRSRRPPTRASSRSASTPRNRSARSASRTSSGTACRPRSTRSRSRSGPTRWRPRSPASSHPRTARHRPSRPRTAQDGRNRRKRLLLPQRPPRRARSNSGPRSWTPNSGASTRPSTPP